MKIPKALEALSTIQRLMLLCVIVSLCFAGLLWKLAVFALGSSLYSYLVLIPFVSAYLFRLTPTQADKTRPARVLMGTLALLEMGLLLSWHGLGPWDAQTSLTLGTTSFVLLLWLSALASLGFSGFKKQLFPLLFLGFMVPMTPSFEAGLETVLQHGSAEVANALFHLSGMTFFRDNLSFQLPTIRLMIAPECSGIHSSLVLFIVSLVAGFLFLRSPWKRGLLTAFVLPLALLRNGFRVWVLGELCVRIDPSMIDSPIHHRGGPLFFVISLIPFSALLYVLARGERKSAPPLEAHKSTLPA